MLLLTRSLDALPKSCRIALTVVMLLDVGWQNRTTSSAYREITGIDHRGCTCCRMPEVAACLIKRPKVSITRMKSWGDSGSPCRRPRRCCIGGPGTPLIRIFVLVMESNTARESRNRLPKPYSRRTSNKKGHEMVSKAFAMSSLSNTLGERSWCKRRMDCETRTKLSCKEWPTMKVF